MRIAWLLFLLTIPSMGMAKIVTVRSGDHADFSRLAFEFSDSVKWEMGRVKDGYVVRIQGSGSEIDISKVYQRISHDRIKNLTVSEDNLRITIDLGCECYADAFEFKRGLLVVDVKEGLPPRTSIFEVDFNAGKPAENQHSNIKAIEPAVQKDQETTEETSLVTIPLRLPNVNGVANPYVKQFGLPSGVEEIQPTKHVVEMQSEILQQISRAASQGLLDANIPDPLQAKSNDHEAGEISEQLSVLPNPETHINIHIENSIDREFMRLISGREATGSESKCLSDKMFNIPEWGNEESILAKILEQRGLISGELDSVDTQAVLGLAKAYIYAGFGAEALSVLSQFDLEPEEKEILGSMAQVIDNGASDNHVKFSDQIGCDTLSALWAALFTPTLANQAHINKTSILGAFSRLPAHLRRLLGPRLAEKFLNIGDLDTARALRNSIARSPGDAGSEYNLLNAKLDHIRGLTDSVEHTLEDIIDTDGSVAPKALVELLEVRLQNGKHIEPRLLATAESYIFEQQDTEIAADLQRLIALSYGHSGDFGKALLSLYKLDSFESLGVQKVAETWEKVIDNLAEEASEEALLKFIFAAKDKMVTQPISRVVRRKLALRLLKEGWPVYAEIILSAPISPTADDRVLMAQIKLQVGDAERVLKELENVAGVEASKVRALAYEMSGLYLDAAEEYELLEDSEKQVNAIWQAEDWTQLATIGSNADRIAADLMLSPATTGDEPSATISKTIARNSTLLKTSESERKSIEQLLVEHPVLIEKDT